MKKNINYLTPSILSLIIFFSNFLGTEIFNLNAHNFSIWFVLSVFAFACGWLINKTLGYVHGGKIVFAVVIGTIFISLIMISLMKNYFGTDKLLSENLVLYTLRNVIVGAMGFFGMAVSEVILLGEKLNSELERNRNQENIIKNANKEAELIVKEAEIKASEIVLDANKEAIQVFKDKAIVEQQLSDLVATEKELLNKYIKTVTKPE